MVNTSSVRILGFIPRNNDLNKETMLNIVKYRVQNSKFVRVTTHHFVSQFRQKLSSFEESEFTPIARQ